MQTEQKDILQTQLNAENNHNSDSSLEEKKPEIFKAKRIEKTPFTMLWKDEHYYLTIGNNLLSMPYDTEKDVMEFLESDKWNIISSLILIVIDKMQEIPAKKTLKEWMNEKEG